MKNINIIFTCLFFSFVSSSFGYIPDPIVETPNVQPFCVGGCPSRTPIPVPEVRHTYDPTVFPNGQFGSWPTTAAAATAAGWSVSASCVAGVGRIAKFNADPAYPVRLRYDAGGFLAGLMFISPNPQGFPFEVRTSIFPGPPTWVADSFWRDPSQICTNGGRSELQKLIFVWTGEVTHFATQYEIPTESTLAQNLGWYDTAFCIPFMGVHFIWVPKVPDPTQTNGPIDLILVFSLDRQHLLGYEFSNAYTAITGDTSWPTPVVGPVWEIDTPRPNKPFTSYSMHVFLIPWSCPSGGCPADVSFSGVQPNLKLPNVITLTCFTMYEPFGSDPHPYPYAFPSPSAPALDSVAAQTTRIPPDPRWRTYDGFANNEALNAPNDLPKYWGIPGTFAHPSGIDYVGGEGYRVGPNSRLISNRLFSMPQIMATSKINDMHSYWGQFITSDVCATERDVVLPPFTIAIPQCDPYMDAQCLGNQIMSEVKCGRVPYTGTSSTNPKLCYNLATSYLDLSQLYGNDGGTNAWIRTFSNGEVQVDETAHWYSQSLGITTPFGYNPFVRAGDIRMNKNPPLISYHTIFRREHNRKARELALYNPTWNDEELFQNARLWTIAVYQSISSHEYTAALLGEPLPPYSGYNYTINPTATAEFCGAAYRYGHSEVNKIFMRMDENFEQDIHGHMLVRDTLWTQMEVNRSGIEPVLRGMLTQQISAADLSFVDDIRQFYAKGPATGLDLPAVNTERGRDMGIPTYNVVRQTYGLAPRTSWDEINPDPEVQSKLQSLYGPAPAGINNLDLYVGALAEPTLQSSNVGETFWTIIRDQFIRMRDGDRYWYENLLAVNPDLPWQWTETNVSAAQSRKLEDVIEDNTAITAGEMGSGIFFLKSRTLEALSAQGAFEKVQLSDYDLSLGFTEETEYSTGALYNIYWRMDPANGRSSNQARSSEQEVIAFQYQDPDTLVTFMLKGKATGWFGMGFHPDNPGSMKGADLYFCRVWDANNTAECRDSFALDVGPPRLDQDTGLGCQDSLFYGNGHTREDAEERYFGGYQDGAETTVWFTRRRDTGDPNCDKVIPYNAEIQLIYAFNSNTDEMKYHGPTRSATQDVNVFTGIYFMPEEDKTSVGLLIALGICAGLGVLMCLILMLIIALKTDHFRFMAPPFCICILIGATVCYGAMFTLLEYPATTGACTAYVWLAGVGFSFMFACLFAKTFRVWRLLSSKSMKASQISTADMAIWIGILVLLEIIFLAIWTGVDNPTSIAKITKYDDTKYSYFCECNDGWWGAYAGIYGGYILVGVFFTILIRNLPPEFNDSKAIGWSMYNLALIWAMAVGLGFGLERWQSARVAIMAFTIFVALTFTILALFGPTVWRILQRKDPRTFKTTMNMSSSRGSKRTTGSSTAAADSTLDD